MILMRFYADVRSSPALRTRGGRDAELHGLAATEAVALPVATALRRLGSALKAGGAPGREVGATESIASR